MILLRWIEHHPFLTISLILIVTFCVIGIIQAVRGSKDEHSN